MFKFKVKKLYYLVLFLLPFGVSGIGLAKASALPGNISFADLFVPVLALLVFSSKWERKSAIHGKTIKSRILKFMLLYFFLVVMGICNYIRFDAINYKNGFFSIFKILICILYAYIYLNFLSNCNQEEWEEFIGISVASAFTFSLSCMLGAALFFVGVRTPLIDYYVTSFRATGLQEDPNLAAIFQLMSISYVLIWRKFYKNRRISGIVLGCVVLGALLTVSKACILTMVACFVMVLLLSAISRNDKVTIRLIVFILIAGLGIAILAQKTSILDLWTNRLASFTSGDKTAALTKRDILWEAAFGIIFASPLNFLFGVGVGQFDTVANSYGYDAFTFRAHNTLISFWVDNGIILPLIIIYVFLNLLIHLTKMSIRKKDDFSLYAFWGVLAIAIFMNSVNFQNNRMGYVFLIFIAVSLYRMKHGEIVLRSNKLIFEENKKI